MYRIKTYNKISVKGLDRFPRDQFEVGSDISHTDAILLRSHRLNSGDISPNLLAIARAGAGVNNIPIDACTEAGVVVFNTPGANANAVKEMVVAGLLLGSRGLIGGLNYVGQLSAELEEGEFHQQVEAAKKSFAGQELLDKTLGVVGLGAIGAQVANIALALGMDVIGYDPALSVESAWRLSSQVQRAENLSTLLNRSDFITLHVPAIDDTVNMINDETLRQVKPGAKLLNFARDAIVNTSAVKDALAAGQLSAYISDFPLPDLAGLEGVLLFPHLGASTAEAEDNCATMAADQIMDFLKNGNIRNSVNFPPITLERASGFRITITNHNVPKVLSHILAVLADQNINVIDMLNKSRGDIAYNILDIEDKPSDSVLEAIGSVDHVINIRLME